MDNNQPKKDLYLDYKIKKFTQINREYFITSAELRKALNIVGEIISIGLKKGRSPNDIKAGKSADEDKWYINTELRENGA